GSNGADAVANGDHIEILHVSLADRRIHAGIRADARDEQRPAAEDPQLHGEVGLVEAAVAALADQAVRGLCQRRQLGDDLGVPSPLLRSDPGALSRVWRKALAPAGAIVRDVLL